MVPKSHLDYEERDTYLQCADVLSRQHWGYQGAQKQPFPTPKGEQASHRSSEHETLLLTMLGNNILKASRGPMLYSTVKNWTTLWNLKPKN